MKPIKIYWWRSPEFLNIGDEINLQVCEHVSGRRADHAELANCDILAIGSVLLFPVNQKLFDTRKEPIHIWGSGSLEPKPVPKETPFLLHALRGPLTRCLTSAPKTLPLGDPGLLAPEIWPASGTKKHKWGIIPHHSQIEKWPTKKLVQNTPDSVLIDVRDPDFARTFETIASCEAIASTSLHGLIFADTYGIPNVWLDGPEIHRGKSWKFFDYFASSGRPGFDPVSAPRDGNLDRLSPDLMFLPDPRRIADMRQRITEAFPKDI